MKRVGVGAALVILVCTASAHAEPSSRAIAAEQLFHSGRDLMAQRRFKEACEALDASEKLDAAIGTLISLGECYAAQGRTASAWFAYRTATALAIERGDPRRDVAEARAAAMAPQLSTLAVHAGDDVHVTVDGEPFAPAQLRAPVPIDPGSHVIEASAPGHSTWSTTVNVRGPAQVASIDVPPLADAVAMARQRDRVRTRQALGIGVGVVGLTAMSAGAIFGMQAIVKGRDANHACPGGGACGDLAAVQENNVAKTYADVSTVTIPIGAAIVAVGAYLFLTARGAPVEASAQVSSSGGRVEVGWSW